MRCSRTTVIAILLLVGFVLVFSISCTSEEELLFFTDVYFDAADAELKNTIIETLTGSGVRAVYSVVPSGTSAETFIEIISRSEARFVSATPLLANLVASAAPVFRDRRFVVLYSEGLVAQENIQRLASDRTNAYFRAGQLAVRLIVETKTSVELGRALVLAFVGNEARRRELETFVEGFNSLRDELGVVLPNPEIREFGSTNDARGAARIVPETKNYSLVFISLSSMNSDVITAIDNISSLPIITEGPLESVPGSDSVVAVIEEDWISALVGAIDSRNPRIPIPTLLLRGPAFDRLGLLTIPAEFD